MTESFKRYPPGRGELLVPMTDRRDALAALALIPVCRASAVLAQNAARGLVRLLGPRALPGGAVSWVPAVPAAAWSALESRWRASLGPWDACAVLGRAQSDREGAALLLLADGMPSAFVKLRRDGEAVTRERAALEAVGRASPRNFGAPTVMDAGEEGGWTWLATSALPPRLHRMPARPPVETIAAEIDSALSPLPRPAGTPAEWRPMHGDFTPWNLRSLDGALWLLDWEEAGWGPPGADRVLYRAAEATLSSREGIRRDPRDAPAAAFWRRRIAARAGARRDRRLATRLDAALAAMGGSAPTRGAAGMAPRYAAEKR